MPLSPVVKLYRACNKPPIDDGDFSCTTDYYVVKDLVNRIRKDEPARFDHLFIDGQDYIDEALPDQGSQIDFLLRLPTASSNAFHNNLDELLKTEPSISRGCIPEDFYLVDEDYYSKDAAKPEILDVLDKICRLVKSLSQLALYHDEKSSSHHLRLVFMQPGEDSRIAPVVLETKVTKKMLEMAKDVDPHLIESLSEKNASNDPHYTATVGVFGTSLANFVGTRSPVAAFDYLVAHWQQFVECYQRDISTYLSGFAFHKAKREVAEAELKIANEFSKVLSEITGKLLSIPVSLAAVMAIPKADSLLQRLLLLAGVLLASVIVSKLVGNQRRQLERIKHAKDLVLGAIEGRKEVYPEELVKSIDGMTINLKNSEKSLENSLSFFSFLSWLPVIAAILIFGYLYYAEISNLFSVTSEFVRSELNILVVKWSLRLSHFSLIHSITAC